MHDGLGEFEGQRVSCIKGHVYLTAEDEILLCIVLSYTVDECGAVKRVACIKREPNTVAKSIADVPFKPGQRLLP